jgi:hypothetical protein
MKTREILHVAILLVTASIITWYVVWTAGYWTPSAFSPAIHDAPSSTLRRAHNPLIIHRKNEVDHTLNNAIASSDVSAATGPSVLPSTTSTHTISPVSVPTGISSIDIGALRSNASLISLVSLGRKVTSDVRGNLGPADVVVTEAVGDWLKDRWQGRLV